VARITRKELKTDKFALEVEHTFTFFEEHQKEIVRYGAIAVALTLLIIGYSWYSGRKHTQRQDALARAIQVQEAPVGQPTPGQNLNFPTAEAKEQAAVQAFQALLTQYPGTSEGYIAEYYIAAIKADQGKISEAEKSFKSVADNGDDRYAALARLSLAQIYFADGRALQGETALRDLIAHPSPFVSKDQATITLARYLMLTKPAEARKLLDPLRSQPGAVGQVALSLYGELPPQ
jgi:predicted negative regulator of RcsB-dependent stress response